MTNYGESCNACMNIATRRGVAVGEHVQLLFSGLTAEVLAINHINSRVYMLLAGDIQNSNLWAPLESVSSTRTPCDHYTRLREGEPHTATIPVPHTAYDNTLPPALADDPFGLSWASDEDLTEVDPNSTLPWRTQTVSRESHVPRILWRT